MVKKYTISFREASAPIIEHVTKFGGQPAWLTEPQWPLSRTTGHPMRFICQIALGAEVFGPLAGRMAYLFMREEEEYEARTWEPDGGENALVIQPGNYTLPTQPLLTGPTLQKWVETPSGQGGYVDWEYVVDLVPGEDPDIIEDIVVRARALGWEALPDFESEDKIGGTPAFLQGPEYQKADPGSSCCNSMSHMNFLLSTLAMLASATLFFQKMGTRASFCGSVPEREN